MKAIEICKKFNRKAEILEAKAEKKSIKIAYKEFMKELENLLKNNPSSTKFFIPIDNRIIEKLRLEGFKISELCDGKRLISW